MAPDTPNGTPNGTLTPGLCSVTLRSHSVEDVAALAAEAGLAGIEWGSDVHVPDADAAARARKACADAGLRVFSLGSYYRAGIFGEFEPALALAAGLGARRVRIWAGSLEPHEADAGTWDAVVEDTRRIAALAAAQGVELAFEFHNHSLTATVEGTLELLDRVARPNVGTYWQPAVGVSDAEALDALRSLLGQLMGIHCFSWWPQAERLPLDAREGLWREALAIARSSGRDLDVMLEFVADDSPENLRADAAALRGWIDAV
ncbi:sugar phosphate isomerase/epimerase family protein [Arthrobacter celericrescens]|uniref:sugar phosphate isomerase/epimerase family protein n=1 Tax=Arthrobacter celericrescens TaxID=2320851 RepID=UPI000EA0A0DB|nr:TIM barrel protein [Arthrobacter celericrescens]